LPHHILSNKHISGTFSSNKKVSSSKAGSNLDGGKVWASLSIDSPWWLGFVLYRSLSCPQIHSGSAYKKEEEDRNGFFCGSKMFSDLSPSPCIILSLLAVLYLLLYVQ
jgi:hypothetical protein